MILYTYMAVAKMLATETAFFLSAELPESTAMLTAAVKSLCLP